MHSFHVGGIGKNPPFARLPKNLTIDVRVLLGESTSTRRARYDKHWELYTHVTGTIPQHPLPILIYMALFSQLQEPPFVRKLVCFAWKLWWKNWECNQPPLAIQQFSLIQPWRSAVWTDEISSSRFRFDPFRSGNGKKRRSWNMLLFLKKPIDASSKQMQTNANNARKNKLHTLHMCRTEVCKRMSHRNHDFLAFIHGSKT